MVEGGAVGIDTHGSMERAAFPVLLGQLCAQGAEALGAPSAALFVYDEIADGFTVAATSGADFATLSGQTCAAADAEALVDVLERNVPSRPERGSLHFQATPVGSLLARLTVLLVPLHATSPVGVFVVRLADLAGETDLAHRSTEIASRLAESVEAARPDVGHACTFRRLLEMDGGAAAILEGDDAVFSYASAGFREMFDLHEAPLLGRRLEARLLPNHYEQIAQVLESARSSGTARSRTDVAIVDAYGSRYFDIHVLPDRAPDGKVVSLMMVAWSRTDSHLVRGALQSTIERLSESESLLSAVLDASNSGIAFVSAAGIIEYANKRVAEFFGFDVHEMLGCPALEIASKSLKHRVEPPQPFVARLEYLYGHMSETAVDEFEVTRPLHRILERYSAPVHMSNGELLGRVEVYTDVTQVRQLQRDKDAFLSLVSHELRTPVTSIKGYAQLLQRRAQREHPSAQTMMAYESIGRQTSRMQDLIDTLLDVTRLQSGKLRLNVHPLDVVELVARTAEMAQLTSEEHRIVLQRPARPVIIEGDDQRLEYVLTNLLTNAMRYSPEGGTVLVSVETHHDLVAISVQDEGIGIAEDSLSRIFERFYRAEGVSESSGLGVGLYITRGIVEQHGGEVSVNSIVGAGSTFTVSLPLGRAAGTRGHAAD